MAENSNGAVINDDSGLKNLRTNKNAESHDKRIPEDVLRPILLEEYDIEAVPESLQNLLKSFESSPIPPTRIDLLVGFIYILMLEYGFVVSDWVHCDSNFDFNFRRVSVLSETLPFSVSDKIRLIKMILPNFEQFQVNLTFVCVSDDIMIVNCFVRGIESGHFTLSIDTLKYFTSSNTDLKKIKFQHLDDLSRKFKNEIAFPVKHSILKQNSVCFPCLEDLPPEITLIIMKKLKITDLLNFGRISFKFCCLMSELLKTVGKKMQ